MEVSESPSKMELEMPTSWTNWIARLVAKVSKVRIEYGMGTFSTIAARISPQSFRITTPKPAAFISSKMVSSKLVFTPPWSWGFHHGLQGCTFLLGVGRDLWNSWRCFRAKPAIWCSGQTTSPAWTLFLVFQIAQQPYERSHKSLNSYSLVEYNKIYPNTNSPRSPTWPSHHRTWHEKE